MASKKYSGFYRVDPQPSLNFSGELIVDLSAGGGGASTGIEWALGRSPDQVKFCGNSVSPWNAYVLVAANSAVQRALAA